jgi:hypothetical protein
MSLPAHIHLFDRYAAASRVAQRRSSRRAYRSANVTDAISMIAVSDQQIATRLWRRVMSSPQS